MTDFSDIYWTSMSDTAILTTIAAFVKHQRLAQNKTQAALAMEAGINRTTLSEFERGMPTNLLTLIQLLRALGQLQVLREFKIQQKISPLLLAERDQAMRKRAARTKNTGHKPQSDW